MDIRHPELLAEIELYVASNERMTETTFGRKAVNDGKFVKRLRAGRRVWPETADRVRQFINENSPVQAGAAE